MRERFLINEEVFKNKLHDQTRQLVEKGIEGNLSVFCGEYQLVEMEGG